MEFIEYYTKAQPPVSIENLPLNYCVDEHQGLFIVANTNFRNPLEGFQVGHRDLVIRLRWVGRTLMFSFDISWI